MGKSILHFWNPLLCLADFIIFTKKCKLFQKASVEFIFWNAVFCLSCCWNGTVGRELYILANIISWKNYSNRVFPRLFYCNKGEPTYWHLRVQCNLKTEKKTALRRLKHIGWGLERGMETRKQITIGKKKYQGKLLKAKTGTVMLISHIYFVYKKLLQAILHCYFLSIVAKVYWCHWIYSDLSAKNMAIFITIRPCL